MHKPNPFPSVPLAAGVLLCAAGIALLANAPTATVRLMKATGADVLSADPGSLSVDWQTSVEGRAFVQRVTRSSLPVHAAGLGLIGLGLWLPVRALRRPQQSALDEQTQRLLAQWVLMRATLQHRLAAGSTPSWQDALLLKVLDYLVSRYKDPGPTVALPPSPRRTRPLVPDAPSAPLFCSHRGAPKPPKGPAAFRPALDEVQRLNVESYADFGFSERFLRNAEYN